MKLLTKKEINELGLINISFDEIELYPEIKFIYFAHYDGYDPAYSNFYMSGYPKILKVKPPKGSKYPVCLTYSCFSFDDVPERLVIFPSIDEYSRKTKPFYVCPKVIFDKS